jgi:tetratricopeptide (TPR) repeat protein
MSNNINRIFSVSACPHEHELLDYAKGRLQHDRKHLLESHLSDCEMCSDYIEGLALMDDADKIVSVTGEINLGIDRLTKKKGRKGYFNFRFIIASAAIFTLLIVVTFILQRQFFKAGMTDEVAQHETTGKNTGKSITFLSEAETEPAERTGEATSSGTGKRAAPPFPAESEIAEVDPDAKFFRPVTGYITQDYDQTLESQKQDRSFDFAQGIADEETTDLLTDIVNKDDRRPEASGTKKTETATVTAFTTKEYRAEEYEQTTISEQTTRETNQGVRLYNESRFEASLNYFEDILKVNPLDQQAQFYYALNLVQLGRKEEGKKILEAIAASEGKYKKQANRELKKISKE